MLSLTIYQWLASFNSYYEKTVATGAVRCIDDEIPFDIPQGWEWVRLKHIISVKSGDFLNVRNLQNNNRYPIYGGNGVNGYYHSYNIHENTLIIGRVGFYCGSVHKTETKAWVTDNALIVTPFSNLIAVDWLLIALQWADIRKSSKATAQPVVSGLSIYPRLIPIPPINEQIQIIEKLEKLLPIVDIYKSQQLELQFLNNSIQESLKKSILQEAIQGKLIPQNSSEGTAEELLEEIKTEKLRLAKEGKLKKSALANESRIFRGDDNRYYMKSGNEIIDIDEQLFEIPTSWRWITLGELIIDSIGLSYKKEDLDDKSAPMVRVLRGGNIEDGIMIFKDDDVRISSKYVPEDLLLKRGTFISPAVSSLEKIGKTALVSQDYSDVVVGGFVLMLTPTFTNKSLRQYLYQFFQSPYYHNFCRTITKKSGQAFYNLSRQKLKQCPVPIPPITEIPRILEKLNYSMVELSE